VPSMRSAVVLVVAVLSLAVVAGCAGDESDTSATTEWADEFCTATLTWSDELQRIADDIGDLGNLSSETVTQAAEEAGTATDDYVEAVRDLGGPGTDSGDEIEDALEELADEVEAEKAEIEDALEDVSGITGLATAGRDIAASASSMFVSLERAFQAFEDADVSGELQTAFEESSACDEITD
jgi:hypothetical protein